MKRVSSLSKKREEKIIEESRDFINTVMSLNNPEVDIDEDMERRLDDKLNKLSARWDQHRELKKGEGAMEEMDRLFTPEEIAKYLQKAQKTVRAYLRDGKIKGVKVGNTWRIKKSDLELFVKTLNGSKKEK